MASGRPRDAVEDQDAFELVNDHFTRKITFQPVSAEDEHQEFSGVYRPYNRGQGFGGGRYTATLPILASMRQREILEAAKDDAARALQRTFADCLNRMKCRRVCYELIEV